MVLHQDHGNSLETCKSAIDMGFTSVMMDGSLMQDGKTPSSFEYNVDATRKVVEMAHAKGVTVEGEIGCWAALKTATAPGSTASATSPTPTRPRSSSSSPAWTRWPSPSAPATAPTSSAKKPTGEMLKMERLIEIHQRLPNTHLVMHGSSSVPQDLQDIINKYGGKLKPTFGVPVEEIQLGIRNGVRKVNVDTDNRLAMTGAIRKVLGRPPRSSTRAIT